MNWKTFCRITTVGTRNKEDVIRSLTPEQLELLKQSINKELSEDVAARREVIVLIDAQLHALVSYHG